MRFEEDPTKSLRVCIRQISKYPQLEQLSRVHPSHPKDYPILRKEKTNTSSRNLTLSAVYLSRNLTVRVTTVTNDPTIGSSAVPGLVYMVEQKTVADVS